MVHVDSSYGPSYDVNDIKFVGVREKSTRINRSGERQVDRSINQPMNNDYQLAIIRADNRNIRSFRSTRISIQLPNVANLHLRCYTVPLTSLFPWNHPEIFARERAESCPMSTSRFSPRAAHAIPHALPQWRRFRPFSLHMEYKITYTFIYVNC